MACASVRSVPACCCSWRSKVEACGRQRRRQCSIRMRAGGDPEQESGGEEAAETLFMRELKKRGLSSRQQKQGKEEGGSGSKPSFPPQWERSAALSREGLDGLIPRAWELLKLGSSFFLVFWPLILATMTVFAAAYTGLGPSFVHGGSLGGPPPSLVDLVEEDGVLPP